jgi:hypothetical protein
MQFAFDLASYEDVRTHAEAIYAALAAGQIPCDGAWADETYVRRFRSWLDAGRPARARIELFSAPRRRWPVSRSRGSTHGCGR